MSSVGWPLEVYGAKRTEIVLLLVNQETPTNDGIRAGQLDHAVIEVEHREAIGRRLDIAQVTDVTGLFLQPVILP